MFLTRAIEGVANWMFGKPATPVMPTVYDENSCLAVPAKDEVIYGAEAADDESPTMLNCELDRSVDTDKPVRIVDAEEAGCDVPKATADKIERAGRLTKWIVSMDTVMRSEALDELKHNDLAIYNIVRANLLAMTEKAAEEAPFHPTLVQADSFEAQVKADRPLKTSAQRAHEQLQGGYLASKPDHALMLGQGVAEKAFEKSKPSNIYEEAGMTSPPKIKLTNKDRTDRVGVATQAAHNVGFGASLGQPISGRALEELRQALPVVRCE
jgi:hypothetical protein